MPKVAIKIGPKTYHVQCTEGEQERISTLGSIVAQAYARLGDARAPLEAENMMLAALFMADDLAEAKSQAVSAVRMAQGARAALEKAEKRLEVEQSKSFDGKAELKAEIATVRKAEARAREELAAAKAELAQLREDSAHQHDLFGSPIDQEALAEKIEALAAAAEATASAMENSQPGASQPSTA